MVAGGQARGELVHQARHAPQFAAPAPGQFHHVGILLVGHDARACRESVRQLEESEFLGAVEGDIPQELLEDTTRGGGPLQHGHLVAATAVLHINGAALDLREAQQPGREFPVDGQGHAKARSRSEGAAIQPPIDRLEGLQFLQEAFGEGGGPQAEGAGHGTAQMGVAGQGHGLVRPGEGDEGCGQIGYPKPKVEQGIAKIEAEREDHLVIAGTAEMNALAHGAQAAGEIGLDGGVAVLQLGRDREGLLPRQVRDALQCADQGGGVGGFQQPRSREHLGVSRAAQGVEGKQGQVRVRILAHGEPVDGHIQGQVLGPEGRSIRFHLAPAA